VIHPSRLYTLWFIISFADRSMRPGGAGFLGKTDRRAAPGGGGATGGL
jgi:hypothetical protein